MTTNVHPVHPCPTDRGHVRPPSPSIGRDSGQSASRRNQTIRVWRVRAADELTGEVRYSRLFQQFHAAKRRAVHWRDLGYVVTVELAEEATFRQVWP